MKKASQILLIVSGALCVIACVEYLLSGLFLLIFNSVFINFIENLEAEGAPSFVFLEAELLLSIYRVVAIVGFVFAFLSVLYGVFCFVGATSESKAFTIVLIILGAVMSRIGLVGAILRLIAITREENRKKAEQQI